MGTRTSRLAAAAIALAIPLLAACGTTVSVTFGEVGDEHSAHEAADPHASGHPSTPPGADGSIELVSDFVAGGGGVTVAQAIDVLSRQPVLVSGNLLRDADGTIWVCDNVFLGSPPRCVSPRLAVLNFPNDAGVFDPALAETFGATTRDGITWLDDHQLFGIVHPANGD